MPAKKQPTRITKPTRTPRPAPTSAATSATADPSDVSRLLANHSQLEISRSDPSGDAICEQGSQIAPDLSDADLVKETLRLVMRDHLAPAAARAQAARTMAEMLTLLGSRQQPVAPPGKPLAELTRSDIEAELAALRSTPHA